MEAREILREKHVNMVCLARKMDLSSENFVNLT